MSVYMLAQINIRDRAEYSLYEAGFMEIFAKYEGRLLSVDESPEILEGDWAFTRTVLLAFPSRESADSWYHSAEYQALARHRFDASDANVIMINGLADDV